MHVPPNGGPPPHRHDFEEMFTVLDGEIEATFRGETVVLRAGETINVPANAPHSFTNAGNSPARLLCLCAPSGQEEFFTLVGQPVGHPNRAACTPGRAGRRRLPRQGRCLGAAFRHRVAATARHCLVTED